MEEFSSVFKNRVDQVFGSLRPSLTPGPGPRPVPAPAAKARSGSSMWSLGAQAVHRREWLCRDGPDDSREDAPCAADFREFSRSCLRENSKAASERRKKRAWESDGDNDDNNDGSDDDNEEMKDGADPEEEERRQMSFMVGLDKTLDFEDEEDEFDQFATGTEEAGERTYLREVNSLGMRINNFKTLPTCIGDVKCAPRDPRANHAAAKARLEEDAREAAQIQAKTKEPIRNDLVKVSSPDFEVEDGKEERSVRTLCEAVLEEENCNIAMETTDIEASKQDIEASKQDMDTEPPPLEELAPDTRPVMVEEHRATTQAVKQEVIVGPVSTKKPIKRVRFAPDVVDNSEMVRTLPYPQSQSKERSSFASVVPDHVKNPSKYTRYTLDWSEEDNEKMNAEAYKACAAFLDQSREKQQESPLELPKSIKFVPRQKGLTRASSSNNKASEVSVSVKSSDLFDEIKNSEESEVIEQLSDFPSFDGRSRGSKKYRSKALVIDNDMESEA